MKKIFGILLALALVLSFSLVTAVPVAAQTTWYVDDDACPGPGTGTQGDPFCSIQDAIDAASSGDTITVAAGTYAGAIVDRQVTIVGDAGGGSVITSGVHYGGAWPNLETAFRLDAGADGTEIRNFTVDCDPAADFFFGVFSRGVDGVVVDSITVNDPVQGITSWGGSNWQIVNNEINYTAASSGGGIGIYVGAMPPDYRVSSGNVIAGNAIIAAATAPDYSTPGICLGLDVRYGGYDLLDGNEDISGNQILNNTVIGNGGLYSAGIEMGVIGLGGDAGKIANTMGLIHDNYVEDNSIDDVDYGLYFYVVQGLTVTGNEIKNCATHGISLWDDFTGTINFNNIMGNAYGLYSDVSSQTIDATLNWWGDASGPYHATGNPGGKGDQVSDNVLFEPWLMEEDGAQTTETNTGSGVDASASTADVSAQATGGDTDTTVTVAEYVGNPTAVSPGFAAGAVFFDVHVGGTEPNTLVVEFNCPGGDCSGMVLRWFDGALWRNVTPVSYTNGTIMATLSDTSSPTIAQLTGTPFGLGGPLAPAALPAHIVGWETYPLNKPAVLAPWIALLAAIMAGAGLLVWRRRRAMR